MRDTKNEIKLKIKYIIIFAVLIANTIVLVSIFGRYVVNKTKGHFERTKAFYFYSDKLEEDTAVFQVDNWSGVDDYVITINMNSRKNNLKVASYDIGYTVSYTCSDNAICQLSKTEGIIYSNNNSDYFNLTITPNRQLETGDKVVVEIEAKSTAKYQKTLKGKFTLVVGKEKLSYQITDKPQNPYMELSLTNTLSYYIINEAFENYNVNDKIDIDTYLALTEGNKAKCSSAIVTISFNPEQVLLDITNESYSKAKNIETTTVNGKTYINKFTILIDAISSTDLRFYKVDASKDYTYPNGNKPSVLSITSS